MKKIFLFACLLVVIKAIYAQENDFSKLIGGVWIKSDTIPLCKNDPFVYGNPFITPDGTKMFFSSLRPGTVSEDKENIWHSERTSGGWSDPVLVSTNVINMCIQWSISVSMNGTLYF